MIRYYTAPVHPTPYTLDDASLVHDLIQSGTTQRMISDVPLCTLLSGGIDSSAIAYHLQQERSDLVAYTAVYDERSRDLRTARIVADALEIELVEVPVPAPTVDDLHTVVQVIEMPHKAQVEIGWPCLRLAQAMSSDGFKVTFTGEGSDELWASYGFAYHALKTADWHEYRRDLFIGQHRKNFARANKAFMAYGVEARLPFLHPALVDHALTLPETAVREGSRTKAVLEYAYRDVLPTEVINRPKVAFQDGMKLKQAISAQIADPARVYRDSFKHQYGTLAKP
jgi:asparagine synthase (glutamine-hydrolysing)